MGFKKACRHISHLHKSGCFLIGLEHFLVMFPSAMLIARLANTEWGTVIELPSILFACGVGTLIFSLLTKGKIPFFLGPSFSYIGFVSYQVAQIHSPNDIEVIRATVFYGYLFAGVLLMIFSALYRIKSIKRAFAKLFPSTIMGPAISLIGLELANMAAQDSGFSGGSEQIKMLAIITLFFIIIFSLLRHHFLQNASILIGVLIGCITATFIGEVQWPVFDNIRIQLPTLYFKGIINLPKQWPTLILAVLPCTMIAFVESLGRVAVFEGMLKRDELKINDKETNRAIFFHSLTSVLTSMSNMMPSAIYAENLAIMNLHGADLSTKYKMEEETDNFINNCYSTYSIYPYIIASIISMCVACIKGLQEFFLAIPMPILGGMELFVFGLISAPGIQMLVDQQVNYKKISNQIITASVFLAGVSNISITYGSLTLRGMSLGLTIGFVVNIVTLVLSHFGYLNERFALHEIIDESVRVFKSRVSVRLSDEANKCLLEKELDIKDIKGFVRQKEIAAILKKAHTIELQESVTKKSIVLLQEYGRIDLRVTLSSKYKTRLLNDHPRITAVGKSSKTVTIVIDEFVSRRILSQILKNAN